MFCPNCGASNPDTATVCSQCNQPIPQFGSTPQPAPPLVPPAPQGMPAAPGMPGTPAPRIADIPNYLVHSIILLVFSLFCCAFACGSGLPSLILAVIALIYSTQVNSKLGMNDVVGAQAASKNAKLFNWISLGLLLIGALVYGLLLVFGAVSSSWRHRW